MLTLRVNKPNIWEKHNFERGRRWFFTIIYTSGIVNYYFHNCDLILNIATLCYLFLLWVYSIRWQIYIFLCNFWKCGKCQSMRANSILDGNHEFLTKSYLMGFNVIENKFFFYLKNVSFYLFLQNFHIS